MRFDNDYQKNVIETVGQIPFFAINRLDLPMIDIASFSKENALPRYYWGLLWKDWKPNASEGTTVFLQDYANRGDENLKKRIYFSALNPELYREKYRGTVRAYFKHLLAPENANMPLMEKYAASYYEYLYWPLHLGDFLAKTPNEIKQAVIQIGLDFVHCLAALDQVDTPEYYQTYLRVRFVRDKVLKDWIAKGVKAVENKGVSEPDKTFVHYWLKNSAGHCQGGMIDKDIVFECFHNFLALAQWGYTLYLIMGLFADSEDKNGIKKLFKNMMETDHFDESDASPYTPLDRFVMELFRVTMPNPGSVSTLTVPSTEDPHKFIKVADTFARHQHYESARDPLHWSEPDAFNPDRYIGKATSDQINAQKLKDMGFAGCPFHTTTFSSQDGRDTKITNSAYGTVYDQKHPVIDDAGFSPFGFGYRRCPGELVTIEVIKEFLRIVWEDNIRFKKVPPAKVPFYAGPATYVTDNLGFEVR